MKIKDEILKIIFSKFSNIIPSALLLNSFNNILLPNYTLVSDQHLPHINNLYKPKTTKQFIKDLDFILKYFTPITLNELIQITKNKEAKRKNIFHLSIDDGLKECYEIILPILINKGIPCTFFLNPSFIDNKDLMHKYKASLIIEDLKSNENKKQTVITFIKRKLGIRRDPIKFIHTLKYPHRRVLDEIAQMTNTDFSDYLAKEQPYLKYNQVVEIINKGFTIGAHSMDHPEYFLIREEEQLRQTFNSIRYITNNFNLAYKAFAFPFPNHLISKNVLDAIINPSDPMADLTFRTSGLINKDIHPYLHRISMEKKLTEKEIIKGSILLNYFNFFKRK